MKLIKASTIVLFLLAVGFGFAADKLYCSSCKKRITGKYLKDNSGKAYCNSSCAEKRLPKCSACKKPIYGSLFSIKGKTFCSERCLQTIMPKCELCKSPMKGWTVILDQKFCNRCITLPRCTECMIPATRGKSYKDSRFVCTTCSRSTLFKESSVNKPYLEARKELKRITGLETTVVPTLKLVSQDTILELALGELHHKPQGIIRGFYSRTEHYRDVNDKTPASVDRSVLMLYGMRRKTYFITSVHESTHDLIAEKFPRLKPAPPWVHEGLCQYMASMAASHHKLPTHYRAIANHPDGAYGDGFRFYLQTFGKNNWPKVHTWIKTVDVSKLPATLPEKYALKRPKS